MERQDKIKEYNVWDVINQYNWSYMILAKREKDRLTNFWHKYEYLVPNTFIYDSEQFIWETDF